MTEMNGTLSLELVSSVTLVSCHRGHEYDGTCAQCRKALRHEKALMQKSIDGATKALRVRGIKP